MLKKTLLAVTVAGAIGAFAAPSFANSVCYDVYADINGTIVDESGCLPE